MKKYQYLLFDVDDTLLDFKENERVSIQRLFEHIEYPLTDEIFKRYQQINHGLWKQFELGQITKEDVLHTRFTRLFQELGHVVDGVELEQFYQAQLGQGAFLIPGAKEIIMKLKDSYQLYIVTNGVSKTQYSRLEKSELLPLFLEVFVSEDAGDQKPSIQFFEYVFERIPGIELDKTLIIGDSLSSDIQGGINAGIDTCWYNPNNLDNAGKHISYTIKSIEEVLDIL